MSSQLSLFLLTFKIFFFNFSFFIGGKSVWKLKLKGTFFFFLSPAFELIVIFPIYFADTHTRLSFPLWKIQGNW